ncbi:MAG: ornithine--oxo-acid transaminase [Deltaproteobacteria bacterium RIFCSPLOWO2_12_FULL_44_12]|nr:MAG: ornithine--oxo-acid transaminase [Deltaproteobacteria bacterium RIFCSPHIGHO2_01_FULL_43_49]OGQ14669.1 MAG: ornithine--oxo-acid transaminase [Deltaproteobacteria bacterium RIFCSPHIGHO2_02_FULL_44_53]OGQ28055.1 MAG: ornithine--oxo-acid transaminase [Deltaproteobacteria bacterium RIFCSPHIGHO2_12_FULL_44_21]OGQ31267.1 MAG: ornithine--oxo-acid transaminase [Deltaproteobacteria bacterium RIFCSPLOWO2_01_FULL_45_74]OGQ43259.1 MAG: ornithine--oxo-acid transaminase [Deltaproteobacteria bacterium 
MSGSSSKTYLEEANKYSAKNYHPLPVVLCKGEGVWVWDVEGKKYLDMLSSYSALNQGHCHPKIVAAVQKQVAKLTLTSRAFHNDQMGPFMKRLCELSGFEKCLLMNSGAEAVETAIKAARRWGYTKKKVAKDKAEIIACENNFHGRTTTIVGFSTEPLYQNGFGPFTPGFKIIPYGDASALEKAITPNTVAFLVEPIQGEAGIMIPPAGYLKKAREITKKNNVLLMADEIQTGLGRTGKLFACEYENVRPDVLIVGKALAGGMYPVSGILADEEVMSAFVPGNHGSTFGGNPLGCAAGLAALDVIVEERLAQRANEMGEYFMGELCKIKNPAIKEVRGKGLLIGIEIKKEFGLARPYCEKLMELGILAKETHDQVIRFAPPLVIKKEEIDWALERILKGLLPR